MNDGVAAGVAPGLREAALPRHLHRLEAEAIQILREVAAEFRNPVLLYSIGKDSSVLLHLARKAFYPGRPPFPLLHFIDRVSDPTRRPGLAPRTLASAASRPHSAPRGDRPF